ncbi:hypothetical protein TH69_10520 [Escherichia coli]|nr:hypothetical protein TH69_10520 [Escherichia coli]AMH22855.1 hypothetical protein C2566_14030 [Escherichia coli B]AMR23720.1 hypothetical protein A0259_14300 [Shigella sp. PAMC 28760]QNG32996.1 hypothetical protein FFHJCLDM_02052 [Escherichia coli BL21]AJH10827.1 hypothetical protein SR36_10315 [Escherichia coli]
MPDATLKRLIMPTQRWHICLRRILHKTTRTLLRLPSGRPFFFAFHSSINFHIVVFVIVISTFKNKSFHYILKSKTNDMI